MRQDTRTAHQTGGTADAQPTLDALIEAHEQLNWSEVPDISNAEAAAWTARLDEARSGGQDA